MDKQRTVNTVTANDEYSQNLMKMYENWMGGDTFQGSYREETVKEEEIPTGQKQGGGEGAAFKTAIGELPAIEFDKSTGLPTIPELGVADDPSKKDPKSSSTGGEPPTNPQGLKPKYGQQVRDVTLVGANEEAEKCCSKCGKPIHEGACATKTEEKKYVNKKVAKIMSYKK